MTAALRAEFAQFIADFKAARPEKFGPRPPYVRPKPDLAKLRAELAAMEAQLRPQMQYGSHQEAMEYYSLSRAISYLRQDIAHYEREQQQ